MELILQIFLYGPFSFCDCPDEERYPSADTGDETRHQKLDTVEHHRFWDLLCPANIFRIVCPILDCGQYVAGHYHRRYTHGTIAIKK